MSTNPNQNLTDPLPTNPPSPSCNARQITLTNMKKQAKRVDVYTNLRSQLRKASQIPMVAASSTSHRIREEEASRGLRSRHGGGDRELKSERRQRRGVDDSGVASVVTEFTLFGGGGDAAAASNSQRSGER
jgi:hypothetical protein